MSVCCASCGHLPRQSCPCVGRASPNRRCWVRPGTKNFWCCLKKLADTITRVGLVANPEKESSQDLVRAAVALIEKSGRTAVLDDDTAKLANSADLLMVFGGDGTMLGVAREIAGSNTPIVGINTGSLGFLTDVQAHQLSQALDEIWAGKTRLETRPLIEAIGPSFTNLALNDFVITRCPLVRLVGLDVAVDW